MKATPTLKRIARALLISALVALLVAVGAILYVSAIGVPHRLVARWSARTLPYGVRCDIRRVRWAPWNGVRLDGISLRTLDEPQLRAAVDRAVIRGLTLPRQDRQGGIEEVELLGALLRVSASATPQGEADGWQVEEARLRLVFSAPGTMRVQGEGRIPGVVRFTAAGALVLPAASSAAPSPEAQRERLRSALAALLAFRPPVTRALAAARWTVEPAAAIDFSADLRATGPLRTRTELHGGRTVFRDTPFSSWGAVLTSAGPELALHGTVALEDGGWFALDGAYCVTTAVARVRALAQVAPAALMALARDGATADPAAPPAPEGRLVVDVELHGCATNRASLAGTLSCHSLSDGTGDAELTIQRASVQWTNDYVNVESVEARVGHRYPGIPANIARALTGAGVVLQAPVELHVSGGGATLREAAAALRGTVRTEALTWRDIPLRSASLELSMADQALTLRNLRATIPGVDHDGGLDGGLRVESARAAYSGVFAVKAEPAALRPALPRGVQTVVDTLSAAQPLDMDLSFAGSTTNAAAFALALSCRGRDLERNGTPIDLCEIVAAYSNDTVRYESVRLLSGSSSVTGHAVQHLGNGVLELDLHCGPDPRPLANLVGPELARLLESISVRGPILADVCGRVGLGPDRERDLVVRLTANDFGWKSIRCERATMDLEVRNDETIARNIVATWCGGAVEGDARLFRLAGSANLRYDIDLCLTEARFADVVRMFTKVTNEEAYRGRLTGSLQMSGDAADTSLVTATGGGNILLADGYVLTIRLFGGLSNYLSYLIPGLGFSSHRELRGTFTLADGEISTPDAILDGALVAIRGAGKCSMRGDLDFLLQVRFLNEGLASIVALPITATLAKAIEFHLGGTTKEPAWRIHNAPTRLLKYLEEKVRGLSPFGESE